MTKVAATGATLLILAALVAAVSALGKGAAAQEKSGRSASAAHLASIAIDYPPDSSIFPPEITPPTFIWRDAAANATRWRIDIAFADGSARMQVESAGARLAIGEIDQRCVSSTNELPKLTPEQAAAHTWIPEAGAWEVIKRHSVTSVAVVTISGFSREDAKHAVSSGRVTIHTSKDPVGAPIFYRDVPLMPSETEKGIIKPLAPSAIPLIQWRLRDIGKPESRVVLKEMHTCANCHSFSRDGKTMGMDMDGPANDKGLYAIVPVKPQITINTTDIVTWNPSHDAQVSLNRVGFMSQVSPDGKYVVTGVNTAEGATQGNYYVVNFKDYRFLQVFYPTRGILAWYSRATGRREPLPGADDPRYVQTDGVWSPDGSYLVFARAEAREPYPPDGKMATYANDPIELQIQYDLYRVPFNGGHGGQPEAIAGASANGMSNTFPKVSPDGRWIVFVKCRNGQLMRPDSQLYIVPAGGGQARRMRCNTALMNSWHSFSPNGRWLVFSSKARSPYTQMYLTHIDEEGNDSPAILIDNSTAANRAVNLPEFVNIPPDGLVEITAPAVDVYRDFDHAMEMQTNGDYATAIPEWRVLRDTDSGDYRVHNNLALSLAVTGQYEEAILEYRKCLEMFPYSAQIHTNLGLALASDHRLEEAAAEFQTAVEMNPTLFEARYNLGVALASQGQLDGALLQLRKAVEINPSSAEAHYNLAIALASRGDIDQAMPHFEKAAEIKPDFVQARYNLGVMLYAHGRVQEALAQWRESLRLNPKFALAMIHTARALAASPNASDRNGMEAVRLAEEAVRLSGTRDPAYLDTLSVAYAEAGRFSEAIDAARRAQELARQQNQADLVQVLDERVKLYEAQKPYRDDLTAPKP